MKSFVCPPIKISTCRSVQQTDPSPLIRALEQCLGYLGDTYPLGQTCELLLRSVLPSSLLDDIGGLVPARSLLQGEGFFDALVLQFPIIEQTVTVLHKTPLIQTFNELSNDGER